MTIAAIQSAPASPMVHLLEQAHVAPEHMLTIDLYQREALKRAYATAPPTRNAEGARWGNDHWDNIPGAAPVLSLPTRPHACGKCDDHEGEFDFLGFTFGQMYSARTGQGAWDTGHRRRASSAWLSKSML